MTDPASLEALINADLEAAQPEASACAPKQRARARASGADFGQMEASRLEARF